MSLHAPVHIVCPHCDEGFSLSARLVRPTAWACCPSCSHGFALETHHDALARARTLRRQRRQRRDDLVAYLRVPASPDPRPSGEPPMMMSDVLRRLDTLLQRLETLPDRPLST